MRIFFSMRGIKSIFAAIREAWSIKVSRRSYSFTLSRMTRPNMFTFSLLMLTSLFTLSDNMRDASPALQLWKAGKDVRISKAR